MSICLWRKRRNRDLHIKRVCGSVFTFTFNIFPNWSDTVLSHFLQIRCKHHPINAPRRYSLVPVVHGIIYELRAKRGSYRKPNGIIDTAGNRRFITHWNGYEMMSIGKSDTIWIIQSVICQEYLDIRSFSARARVWIFRYLTLITIGFQQAEFGKFSSEISNFREVFISGSYVCELEGEFHKKERTFFVVLVIFSFLFFFWFYKSFAKTAC